MSNRSEISVAVLAGGTSSEREISLQSGANVVDALTQAGYVRVELLDPATEGFLHTIKDGGYNIAFIAMHGELGEDGHIQSILEFLGIPYTGSGVMASACAADKDVAKLLYARAGIPEAPGVAIERGEDYDVDAITAVVGTDSFVKPAVNGSSYGVSAVKDPADLPAAIELAFKYSDKVLVEKRLVGTEVSIGVFDDGKSLRALPIVEICVQNEGADFYDLKVKYMDPAKIHRIPAQLPADVYAHAQELACRAHEALGCYGFSRTDFIVTDEGPVILETNTIPGMTSASLYPDEIRHTDDLTFPEVCATLIDLGFARAGR